MKTRTSVTFSAWLVQFKPVIEICSYPEDASELVSTMILIDQVIGVRGVHFTEMNETYGVWTKRKESPKPKLSWQEKRQIATLTKLHKGGEK